MEMLVKLSNFNHLFNPQPGKWDFKNSHISLFATDFNGNEKLII